MTDPIASGPAGDRCAFVPVHSELSRTYKTDAVREKFSRGRIAVQLANVGQCPIGVDAGMVQQPHSTRNKTLLFLPPAPELAPESDYHET